MKPHAFAAWLVALTVSAFTLVLAAPTGAPTLVIVSPRAGQPYSQATVTASVRVVDGPEQPLEVRFEALGIVHRVLTNPRVVPPPRPGQPAGVPASDGYWFLPAGPATFTVSVWRPGAAEPLIAPQSVSFTVTAPASKDLEVTKEMVRSRITAGERSRVQAKREYERAVWYGQRGSKPEWVQEHADVYLARRHEELRDRLTAYCMLAGSVYEAAGNAGDALRTLRLAEAIYTAEGQTTVAGPYLRPVPAMYLPHSWTYAPAHYHALTNFYLRRQAPELAIAWKVKEAEWYRAQAEFLTPRPAARQESLNRAAAAYREIGSWSVLFAHDPEGRARWERKAAEIPTGAGSAPASINLLDIR